MVENGHIGDSRFKMYWFTVFLNDFRMNRAAQHACERDSSDKHHAQNLDDRMQQLRNSSQAIGFQPGIENVDAT